MCGISGWWNPSGVSVKFQEVLNTHVMIQQLQHRGPSAQASQDLVHQDTTYASLGTARLAIVGVENGDQPVQSPCRRWWVSMNGEIYNHASLRRECLGNEVEPSNDSDTAVVAALLTFLPFEKVIERLRGMFALAIVDTENRICICCVIEQVKSLCTGVHFRTKHSFGAVNFVFWNHSIVRLNFLYATILPRFPISCVLSTFPHL